MTILSSYGRRHCPPMDVDSSSDARDQALQRQRVPFGLAIVLSALLLGSAFGLIGSAAIPVLAGLSEPIFASTLCGTAALWLCLSTRRVSTKGMGLQETCWLVLWIAGTIGFLMNPSEWSLGRLMIATFILLRYILVFEAIPRSFRCSSDTWLKATRCLTLVVYWVVVIGSLVVAQHIGANLLSGRRLTGEGNGWLNANSTGLLVALGILTIISDDKRSLTRRLMDSAPGVYVLLLTQSRTATAALLVAAIVLIAHRMQGMWRFAVVSVLAIGAVLQSLDRALLVEVWVSLRSGSSFGARLIADDSWLGRIARYKESIVAIAAKPVFGYGFASTASRFENGYLSTAVETGIVGLLCFVLLLVLTLVRANRLSRSSKLGDRQLGEYVMLFTILFAVHALGERTTILQLGSVVANLWILLSGIVFAVSPFEHPADTTTVNTRARVECYGLPALTKHRESTTGDLASPLTNWENERGDSSTLRMMECSGYTRSQ